MIRSNHLDSQGSIYLHADTNSLNPLLTILNHSIQNLCVSSARPVYSALVIFSAASLNVVDGLVTLSFQPQVGLTQLERLPLRYCGLVEIYGKIMVLCTLQHGIGWI